MGAAASTETAEQRKPLQQWSAEEVAESVRAGLESIGVTDEEKIKKLVGNVLSVQQSGDGRPPTNSEEQCETLSSSPKSITFEGLSRDDNGSYVDVTEVNDVYNFDSGTAFEFFSSTVRTSPHDDGDPTKVKKRPRNPFEVHYPLHYVPGYILLQLESIPTHEELVEMKAILKIHGNKHLHFEGMAPDMYGGHVTEFVNTHLLILESGNYLSTTHRKVFFSHRWVQGNDGRSTPDNDNNVKLKKMKEIIKPNDLVWMDYMCIPQAPHRREEQQQAIASLPHYIGFADRVQILYSDEENERQYATRAFTNIELVCACTPIESSGCIEMDNTSFLPLCPIYTDDSTQLKYPFKNPAHADMYDKRDLPEILKLVDVVKEYCKISKYKGAELLKFLEAPP